MNFQKIPTPAKDIFVLKAGDFDEDGFRPAASGDYSAELQQRVEMEAVEIALSKKQPSGFIASAAHMEKSQAIRNAKFEAIERISLSAWWSLNRPIIAKYEQRLIDELLKVHDLDGQGFDLNIGFIEPACETGFVAVAILENSQQYPFTVLGGSYKETAQEAAHHAFLESLQSWTATKWIRDNELKPVPAWDIGNLRARSNELRESADLEKEHLSTFEEALLEAYFKNKTILTDKLGENHAAWVYPPFQTSLLSHELARIAQKNSEQVTVFSQYNW